MTDPTAERFRALVEERFRYLETLGFRRSPADDRETPVGVSVAYAGRHVGFLASFDVRDAVADVRVVRAREGRLVETGAGGYSQNLLSHLVEHAGYRGRGAAPASGERLEQMVAGWAELLMRVGGTLLEDRADSLPAR